MNIDHPTRNIQFPSLMILFMFVLEKYRQTSLLDIPGVFDIQKKSGVNVRTLTPPGIYF
jgi:hypothetical protein